MASKTHQQIAHHLRALAHLFDELSVEVTARRFYDSNGYRSIARQLGVGILPASGGVKLTEAERRAVRAEDKRRSAEREQRKADSPSEAAQNFLSWASLT